jgi:hypothetical protein
MTNPKVLILDVDYRNSGTSSIADDARIEQVFGFRPLHIKSFEKFDEFMKNYVEEHKISEFETTYRLKPPYDRADVVVVDTLTGLQSMVKRNIQKNAPLFTQQDYGKLGDKLERTMYLFSCLDKDVIFNIHSKDGEDGELSRIIEVPGLVGQAKDNVARYLDIIMYTNVTTNKLQKTIEYRWQVIPDERRNARALPSITEKALDNNGLMDQDYKQLFELIRKHISSPVKIGVFGKPGTGKTTALGTLKNIELNAQ